MSLSTVGLRSDQHSAARNSTPKNIDTAPPELSSFAFPHNAERRASPPGPGAGRLGRSVLA